MKTLISKIFIGFLVTAASFASGHEKETEAFNDSGRKAYRNYLMQLPVEIRTEAFIANAANRPCLPCLELFLETGVDINAKSLNNGSSWKHLYGDSALVLAVQNNREEAVRFLLSKGADVNIRDDYENTPLILAAIQDNYNIAKLLLDGGADIDAKNIVDSTAMIYAFIRNNTPMLNLLRDYAAKKKHSEL